MSAISLALSLKPGTTGVLIIRSTPLFAILTAFSKMRSLPLVVYSLCFSLSECFHSSFNFEGCFYLMELQVDSFVIVFLSAL